MANCGTPEKGCPKARQQGASRSEFAVEGVRTYMCAHACNAFMSVMAPFRKDLKDLKEKMSSEFASVASSFSLLEYFFAFSQYILNKYSNVWPDAKVCVCVCQFSLHQTKTAHTYVRRY